MDCIHFRRHNDNENIEMTFRYKNIELGLDRQFNFQRKITESIETAFTRIQANFEKELKKKKSNGKKKKTEAKDEKVSNEEKTIDGKPQLVRGDSIVSNVTWIEVFASDYERLVFRCAGREYKVTYNYPYFGQVTLPSVVLVGFKCYPTKCEVFFAQESECLFHWYRANSNENSETNEWTKCGETFFYAVQREDLNHYLKLICIPRNGSRTGAEVEVISKNRIEAGPGFSAFEQKHAFTSQRLPESGKQFRVVSYNLLADYYCDSDYSRKELFPYCPPFALAIDYRKLLFINEIIGYNADICCLQEVDAKIFDLDLTRCLEVEGFAGTMQRKGDTAEGLATFYHKSKFELIEKHGLNLGENIPKASYFSELYERIKSNEKLCERMLTLSTALQVTVLKHKAMEKYLIVANTHLYFHPDADHIRLLQIGFFMLFVKHIYTQTKDMFNLGSEDISIIFCGDFNSVPECGIYKLMTEKFVPDHFVDFKSNEEEAVTGVSLNQPFDISSSYNNPKYTNFTVGFAACLDYIFHESNTLRVIQAVPLPSEEELRQFTAIPSIVFPSDHIALVADVEWIEN